MRTLINNGTILAAATGIIANIFARQWYLPPLLAGAAAAAPTAFLLNRRSARFYRFEEQFPEALDLLSRALRAGRRAQGRRVPSGAGGVGVLKTTQANGVPYNRFPNAGALAPRVRCAKLPQDLQLQGTLHHVRLFNCGRRRSIAADSDKLTSGGLLPRLAR